VSPRASTAQVLFSGDLLFAGSIGRTDLPGGDYPAILDSLSRVCLPLPDDVQVLPGHGPQTTIGAERATNPFLAGLTPGPSPRSGPAPAAGPKGPGL
jgi:hydroxyacylglutathione hydrolase